MKLTRAGRGESARMKTRARVLSEFPSLHAGKKKVQPDLKNWGGGGQLFQVTCRVGECGNVVT